MTRLHTLPTRAGRGDPGAHRFGPSLPSDVAGGPRGLFLLARLSSGWRGRAATQRPHTCCVQETGTGVVAEPTGPQGWVANLRSPPHSETAGPLLGLHRWWQDVEMHQQVLTGRLVPLTEALAVLKGCAVRLSVPVVKAAPAPAAPTPSPQAHKRPRAADAGDAAASAGTQLLRVLEHPVACHVETLPSIMAAFQQDGAPNTATEWTIYLHTPKPGWTRHWRPVLEVGVVQVVTVCREWGLALARALVPALPFPSPPPPRRRHLAEL